MRAPLAITLLLIIQSADAQEAGNRLMLICGGGGSANEIKGSPAYGWDNHGNSANAVVMHREAVGFEDALQLWVEGDQGKVRLSHAILPKLHCGDAGWFDIRDVRIPAAVLSACASRTSMRPNCRTG